MGGGSGVGSGDGVKWVVVDGVGRMGSWRRAIPFVRTIWTSYESKKCQP